MSRKWMGIDVNFVLKICELIFWDKKWVLMYITNHIMHTTKILPPFITRNKEIVNAFVN